MYTLTFSIEQNRLFLTYMIYWKSFKRGIRRAQIMACFSKTDLVT